MALTATPIYTHSRDLVNLSRVVGIPWFSMLAADKFESQMFCAIKQAKIAKAAKLEILEKLNSNIKKPNDTLMITSKLSMQELVINFTGKMLTLKHKHILSEFCRFSGPAVLVMSSISMMGINLLAAHIMIFMACQCIIYDQIAARMADVMLSGLMWFKKELLRIFTLNSAYAQDILNSIHKGEKNKVEYMGNNMNSDSKGKMSQR
ncbi:hypothetical protein OBBRIDRAFT_802152 [Obba rivulosa]|uniref:Uncharacterized protein n=1 Tax=Obba rivulosa TaxID=1052685 RepID=A0A8E2DMR9_9APHY|nr:hypothetical protein OBBRIDRAFT_802152 [Obba rivulosa]